MREVEAEIRAYHRSLPEDSVAKRLPRHKGVSFRASLRTPCKVCICSNPAAHGSVRNCQSRSESSVRLFEEAGLISGLFDLAPLRITALEVLYGFDGQTFRERDEV